VSAERENETRDVPAVSVIMVCYNGWDLLPESLASLRAQTFQDWELVFWDNGSTDGSADLARASDVRTRVSGGPERLTLGAARGKAVAESRGELIAFLDHDDLWRPDKLQRQVDLIGAGDAGLCYSDCHVMGETGAALGRYARRIRPHAGSVRLPLLVENFIPTLTVMLSREAYEKAGPFDPSINMPADYEQWLRVTRDSGVAFDAEPLASYRLRRGGLTSDLDTAYGQVEALYERLAEQVAGDEERRWLARGRAWHYWRWAGRGLLERGGFRSAVSRFSAGWRAAGGHVRASMELARFVTGLARGLTVRMAMSRERGRR
jgi:glycosyl transferase family 2